MENAEIQTTDATNSYDILFSTESGPGPSLITVESNDDGVAIDAGSAVLQPPGRIVGLSVTVQHVCPGRRVALAVLLCELDESGQEYPRGIKTLVIPAHDGDTCRNIKVTGIQFVLPEELSVSGGSPAFRAAKRNFKAKIIANFIDFHCSIQTQETSSGSTPFGPTCICSL